MEVRRPHVVHGFVVLAVLIQLGFAIAFIVDAAETNSAYDAISSDHVVVHGHSLGCATFATGTLRSYRTTLCRVDYRYADQTFSSVIPYGETMTFYIDPRDTSYRMDQVTFDKGPEATAGDLAFASVAGFGALAVTVVHLEHLRVQRLARRGIRAGGEHTGARR